MENKTNEKLSIRFYLSLVPYLYALFAFQRIKSKFTFSVDQGPMNNIFFMILLVAILSFYIFNEKIVINKHLFIFSCFVFLFLLINMINFYKINDIGHWFIAIAYFFGPILMMFISNGLNTKEVKYFIKIIIFINIVYSIISILASINYNFFLNLIGVNSIAMGLDGRYRANLMLGSSISISYFLNMSLPFLSYSYFINRKRESNFIFILSIILNISATIVLRSRMSFFTLVIILFFVFRQYKMDRRRIKINILNFTLLIVMILLIVKNVLPLFDFSRLLTSSTEGKISSLSRFNSIKIAYSIFKENLLIGSGFGKYYLRVFNMSDRYFSYGNLSSLVDPHNVYALVLSETGILGFIVFVIMLVSLFLQIINYEDRLIKLTSKLVFLSFLVNGMGGSQLFNEISITSIFWIYLGLLSSMNRNSID